MWNLSRTTLACLCLGIVFSGNAMAANQQRPVKIAQQQKYVKQKVAFFEFNSRSERFADFLNPGQSLGERVNSSIFIRKKGDVSFTINSFILLLPYVNEGLSGLLALTGNLTDTGWNVNHTAPSLFAGKSIFHPLLIVFYQQEISNVTAVPEASAGAMMALSLPLLGWLVWRRQRQS